MDRDFYSILGIPRDADQTTIKKAYRAAAMKWHPDKNPGNVEEAQKKFQDISDAFQCLSDPEKKAIYDRYGEEGMTRGGGGGRSSATFINPEEIFRRFFGQSFGMRSGGFRTSFFGSPFDDDFDQVFTHFHDQREPP